MKVNLFIVGAPKCGTTAWYEYLNSHPDVFFSEVKEPTFFAPDLPGMQWTRSLSRYERLFRKGKSAKVLGDASACHLFSTVAAANIASYNPGAKILAFLRKQEDFLVSLHNHFLARFEDQIEDLEEAWRMSGNRPPETIPPTCTEPRLLDYQGMGRFSEQLQRYLEVFPAEQIKVVTFEQWSQNPRSTYVDILRFLGLEDDGRTEFPRINEAKSYPVKWLGKLITHPPQFIEMAVAAIRKLVGRDALGLAVKASKLVSVKGYQTSISPEFREQIRAYYEEDNRQLAELLTKIGSDPTATAPRA